MGVNSYEKRAGRQVANGRCKRGTEPGFRVQGENTSQGGGRHPVWNIVDSHLPKCEGGTGVRPPRGLIGLVGSGKKMRGLKIRGLEKDKRLKSTHYPPWGDQQVFEKFYLPKEKT